MTGLVHGTDRSLGGRDLSGKSSTIWDRQELRHMLMRIDERQMFLHLPVVDCSFVELGR